MTWVSLVCLLALSSAAFGRSVSFDGYGSTRIIEPPPLPTTGYGREILPPLEIPPTRISTGYGSSFIPPPPVTRVLPSYGGYGSTNRLLERVELIVEPSPADILCRGQLPQTVIPIEGNRKFVTCLDDGKGFEQPCPKGLFYHELTRRCERRLGPLEDFCASQPCLNGGLCVSGDSTFQCQCPAGFDGIVCELDARFCQNNRPCGTDPSVRCQSFRPGAALEWICVSDEDFTYGPDGAHVHKSFCDGINMGPHPLAYTNKGFMMCNGEHSHYESCPGGTIWDGLNKACVWPDMEEGETRIIGKSGYGGYGSTIIAPPPVTRTFSSYDKVILPRPKVFSSYGGETRRVGGYGGDVILPPMPETKVFSSYGGETRRVGGYGGDVILPPPMPETKVFSSYGGEKKLVSGYGGDVILPPPMPETKVFSSYGGEKKLVSGYGGDVILPPPMPETRVFSSYGGEKKLSGYGGDVILPPITKTFSGYGGETLPVPETRTFSSYGSSRLIPPAPVLKVASSYGGY